MLKLNILLLLPAIALLALALTHADAAPMQQCFDNMPAAAPPTSDEQPLCGNGVLDAGETCDDGNRDANDGCNAFCSAFDAMTTACTLAGRSTTCAFGNPRIGISPAQTIFCNLRAIDADPLGAYVVLADGGSLFRYDLFTDSTTSIQRLPASATFNIQPICSLAVMPDASIMIHECSAQRLRSVTADGQTAYITADIPLKSAASFRAYYDKPSGLAVIAGEPLLPATTCMQVWTVVGTSKQLLADVPCIVYNVWADGIVYPSYSITGMHAQSVVSERCPRRMQQTGTALCYAVSLQRDDLQHFTVYTHIEGGTDVGFAISTNIMDNAMGPTITKTLGTQVYTSRGSCFMSQSKIITSKGRTPPTVTLGNACRNVPLFDWRCATPLNNPFMTDVISSPYLLPRGLSSTHTHLELSDIFSATCESAPNATSGPMMYKNLLDNTYANTTPLDFVPLASTGDIVFITSTSVGLISTKRTVLFDRSNPGYCRATNLLYCPHGTFGAVGDVCHSCTNTTAPMHGRSVAWQIKCAGNATAGASSRRLLSLAQTPPFERFSMVVGSADSVASTVHQAIAQYTTVKGIAPPAESDTFLSPMQQYNMAADSLNSLITGPTSVTLIECLIAAAENTTKRAIFKNNTSGTGAEFTATLVSYAAGQPLLSSIARPVAVSQTDGCSYLLGKDPLQGWLRCTALSKTVGPIGRRLLQTTANNGVLIVEHQGTTLASNSIISWSSESSHAVTPPVVTVDKPAPETASPFPIWAAAVVAAAGVLVLLFVVFIAYRRRGALNKAR